MSWIYVPLLKLDLTNFPMVIDTSGEISIDQRKLLKNIDWLEIGQKYLEDSGGEKFL